MTDAAHADGPAPTDITPGEHPDRQAPNGAGGQAVADGAGLRRAQASVNVAAIARNCARLRTQLRHGAALCAVVKADGYGHGALASAPVAPPGWPAPTRARRVSCERPACVTRGCW